MHRSATLVLLALCLLSAPVFAQRMRETRDPGQSNKQRSDSLPKTQGKVIAGSRSESGGITYEVGSGGSWTDPAFTVGEKEAIEITVRPQDYWNVVRVSGPTGNGVIANRPTFVLPGAQEGALIIKYGREGKLRAFSGDKVIIREPGPIYFIGNDESDPQIPKWHNGFGDNWGWLGVTIKVVQ